MAKKLRPIVTRKCGDDVEMMVFNTQQGIYYSVEINLIHEYNPLGRKTKRYRVEKNGRTIASYISLTEAKKIATESLRDCREYTYGGIL